MKSDKNILIAFILNLFFSAFEFVGAVLTGSVAILSDAFHDLGDALSIGLSYVFEKLSKKKPDERHTYGYVRYSVFGGTVTTLILLVGSLIVIYNAVKRIMCPSEINCDFMIVIALVGMAVNLCAALITRKGKSINQKAVNIHMLEDVLGWAVVFIGAIVMRFTGFTLLDPLMSIGVALFIFYKAFVNLKEAFDTFLEKTPCGISVAEVERRVLEIDGVADVHHIHLWSLDGNEGYATMHVVLEGDSHIAIKERIRQGLSEMGVIHTTIETENEGEKACVKNCKGSTVKAKLHKH